MLQSRLENQQFNPSPILLTTDRIHTGFITTDRPDSSHLVDLHVYLIPKNVWKDAQHLAQNEAMDDAVSVGFVRVPPNMKIRDLRESIEQLCGTEDYFPRDFIFLRSVGRCLTRVKPKQENDLKVKNYRPPQTIAPEIYLLEGHHEDYAHLPSASPALSSPSYIFNHQNQARHGHDHSPTRNAQGYHSKSIRGGKHYPPIIHAHSSVSHLPSSGRQSWAKFTQIGSDPDETSPKDFSKLKEEQERLRRRQAELERMRRAAEEKKAQTERDEDEQRRRRQHEKLQAEHGRVEQEQHAATTIQASYRGFKDRQTLRERKQRIEVERREAEAKRRQQIDEEEKRRARELEEQRRKEAAKRQQRDDPETLRARLHELRVRRAELERIREEVIRHLKNIHNRITIRRKEARDMWKKKYFSEKKKTPPLEERAAQLKADLEHIHRKTVQTIDAEAKHALQMGYAKESDIGNFFAQVTNNHHDIQETRHQVEQVKLRLTTDIKLRNQAESECRILRHELNQAKMNLNHIKTRVGA